MRSSSPPIGGAIRSSTVYEILTKQGQLVDRDAIEAAMTFKNDNRRDFLHFLNKFKILDEIKWDEKAIELALKQVIWDISREQIDYAEIKFSTNKFTKQMGCSPREIIKLAHQIVKEESSKWGVMVPLILSLKYESDRNEQLQAARLIEDNDVAMMIDGIDLVGDEAFLDPDFYAPIFADWRKAGKGLIAHVGESQSVMNIWKAVERLNVNRIAHGLRVVDDINLISLTKERQIAFDIALTSNVFTGVVPGYVDHPVKKMIESGCIVTIGTDDPAIIGTTLDREYEILRDITGVSDEVVIDIMHNSVKHAFGKTISISA